MPAAHLLLLNFEDLLIRDFKDHLEKKGVSKVTRKNYTSDIRNFLSRVSLSDTVEGVSGRLNKYIVESGQIYSPATLKRKLSSLRTFFAWALDKGYLKENSLIQGVGRLVDQKTQNISGSEDLVYQKSQHVGVSGKSVSLPLRHPETPTLQPSDLPTFQHSDPLSFPTSPRPSNTPVPMPSQLTTPYKLPRDSLLVHRAKTTAAAVSGFGSVFVILFIVKSLFGNSLLGLVVAPQRQPEPVGSSFGSLLVQTSASPELPRGEPTVLGTSAQEALYEGSALLEAGNKEVSIYNPNLTADSRIKVIPENSIEGALFVANVEEGYFTVEVDHPAASDIPFSWKVLEP